MSTFGRIAAIHAQNRLEAQRQQDLLSQRKEMLQGLLGQRQSVQTAPAGSQAEFNAFNQVPFEMAGQMTPDQQAVTEFQQGKGLLGGQIGPTEAAFGLLGMPGLEQVGGQLLSQQLQPQGMNTEVIGQANTLRKEFTKATQDFADQNNAFGRILASAENPSPSGDLALLFNFMKVLDPTSVVRESEFAAAARAGDLGDRMQSLVNQVMNGRRLSNNQRRDFVQRAQALFNNARDLHRSRVNEFTGLAQRQDIPSDLVIYERNLVNSDKIDKILSQSPEKAPEIVGQPRQNTPQNVDSEIQKLERELGIK